MSEIQVTLCTSDNRGDHGADVRIAHTVTDGETVENFVHRVMRMNKYQERFTVSEPATSWIELRLIEPPKEPDSVPEYSTTSEPF